MANQLASATSPYLLQHKDNPVDWYPWCDEALERARREEKPIFVSIGYSACHWCHVMEHESFENPQIAEFLNQHFICIKVDREERPDLDHVYMAAVQMMTGRGGWPLSVFLTPQLKPFYGGTYWPPQSRHGLPGFMEVLRAVADAWQQRREQAGEMAEQLTRQLEQIEHPARDERALPNADEWHAVFASFAGDFDGQHGGFGGAPKFPQPMLLEALLRDYCRFGDVRSLEMATHTLQHMYQGGIYDHLGGGFARYSVDAQWLVPHFEKMLYDNALLAHAYLLAWQVTRDESFGTVVRETLDYVLRDMTLAGGAFAASEDADSEGEEGRFYTWSWDELSRVLGEQLDDAAVAFGLKEEGNWEGANILHLPRSLDELARLWDQDAAETRRLLEEMRQKLLAARSERVRPGRDDKVIVSWNAMMIRALAAAGAAMGECGYVQRAIEAAEFLQETLVDEKGRLHHSWSGGQLGHAAFADDYAALIDAAITLHQATGQTRWLEWGRDLAESLETLFLDHDAGGFFMTGSDEQPVWIRPKPITDSSVPSANNSAATALARLGAALREPKWTELAVEAVRPSLLYLERAPLAAAQALVALDWLIGPAWTAVLSDAFGSPVWKELSEASRASWLPRVVFRWGDEPGVLPPDWSSPAEPALLVCQAGSCRPPLVGRDAIGAWLAEQACTRCSGPEND